MKKLILLAAGVLGICLPVPSQLTLEAGQQYSFTFSTLPFFGHIPFGAAPGGVVEASVNLASLQTGDMLLIEMFEDLPVGSPLASRTLTSPLPSPDSVYALRARGATTKG